MSAICITFGEQSENHVGMTKNGDGLSERGYSYQDLIMIKEKLSEKGIESNIVGLHDMITNVECEEAYVLFVNQAVQQLLSSKRERKLFTELSNLSWDTQYWDQRRSKVLNKQARYNLCFGDEYVTADFDNGNGTMIAYDMVPTLKSLRKKMMNIISSTVDNTTLQTEGNYYYNIDKTGIGFHGDSERKRVIGINLSDADGYREIHWRWFHKSNVLTLPFVQPLHTGDMYIMSEKASGYDWKKRNIPTLRHAAGGHNSKYLKTK